MNPHAPIGGTRRKCFPCGRRDEPSCVGEARIRSGFPLRSQGCPPVPRAFACGTRFPCGRRDEPRLAARRHPMPSFPLRSQGCPPSPEGAGAAWSFPCGRRDEPCREALTAPPWCCSSVLPAVSRSATGSFSRRRRPTCRFRSTNSPADRRCSSWSATGRDLAPLAMRSAATGSSRPWATFRYVGGNWSSAGEPARETNALYLRERGPKPRTGRPGWSMFIFARSCERRPHRAVGGQQIRHCWSRPSSWWTSPAPTLCRSGRRPWPPSSRGSVHSSMLAPLTFFGSVEGSPTGWQRRLSARSGWGRRSLTDGRPA